MPKISETECPMVASHAAFVRKGRFCPVCNFNRPQEVDLDQIVGEMFPNLADPMSARVDTPKRTAMAVTDKKAG